MKTKMVELPVTVLGDVEVKEEKWTDPGPNEPTGAGSPVPSKSITAVHSDGGIIYEDLHDALFNIIETHGPGWNEVTKIDVMVRKDNSVRVDLIHEGEKTFAETLEDMCEAITEDKSVDFKIRQKAQRILCDIRE